MIVSLYHSPDVCIFSDIHALSDVLLYFATKDSLH